MFNKLHKNYNPVQINKEISIGGEQIILIAGPCSVESYEQTRLVAEAAHKNGLQILRGGAYKPRTSPHSFQGLGEQGLKILRKVADEFGLLVISEALGVEQLPIIDKYVDIIQIGSRNMQHYPLLWAVGEMQKPVVLKRGFMSTIDEWLSAAEHIADRGNQNIILCERGIRGFDKSTRNVLDTTAIALVKQISPYPVIADPSHATGLRELVLSASRAALAAGADGLLIEVHGDPENALSDGEQSITLDMLPDLIEQSGKIADVMGRKLF